MDLAVTVVVDGVAALVNVALTGSFQVSAKRRKESEPPVVRYRPLSPPGQSGADLVIQISTLDHSIRTGATADRLSERWRFAIPGRAVPPEPLGAVGPTVLSGEEERSERWSKPFRGPVKAVWNGAEGVRNGGPDPSERWGGPFGTVRRGVRNGGPDPSERWGGALGGAGDALHNPIAGRFRSGERLWLLVLGSLPPVGPGSSYPCGPRSLRRSFASARS